MNIVNTSCNIDGNYNHQDHNHDNNYNDTYKDKCKKDTEMLLANPSINHNLPIKYDNGNLSIL